MTYQKQYGGGYGQYYEDSSGDFSFSRDPNAGFAPTNSPNGVLVVPTSEDASYGHVFDRNLMVYQWDAFYILRIMASPGEGQMLPMTHQHFLNIPSLITKAFL